MTISELENHLKNCKSILDRFIKKHDIITAYLTVDDVVSPRVHSRLNLEVGSEFDNYTRNRINMLLYDLQAEFREYLEKNKIEYPLHMTTEKHGWATLHIRFYFEISVK